MMEFKEIFKLSKFLLIPTIFLYISLILYGNEEINNIIYKLLNTSSLNKFNIFSSEIISELDNSFIE